MFVDMPKGRLSVNGNDEPSLAIFFFHQSPHDLAPILLNPLYVLPVSLGIDGSPILI